MSNYDLLKAKLKEIGGCGDHGCLVSKPSGMGTNGAKCSCISDEKKMQKVLLAYKAFAYNYQDET